MKQLISKRTAFAAAVLLCCGALFASSNLRAQQTAVGYVDQYGNGILTVNVDTIENAFTDELNYFSNDSVHDATFNSVSITEISGTYRLVACGNSPDYYSVSAGVTLRTTAFGDLVINDGDANTCNGGCPTGLHYECVWPTCSSGVCVCIEDDETLHNGPNHLGNFY